MARVTRIRVGAGSLVERIEVLNDERWDRMVVAHPLGWVSHTSAWAQVLVESFPQLSPCYLGWRGKSGELEAGLPLCRVRSLFGRNRIVSLPFSTLCWPLTDSPEKARALFKEAEQMAKDEGAALEIRSYADLGAGNSQQLIAHSGHCTQELDLAAVSDTPPHNVRRPIRKAEAAGLTCHEAVSESELAAFYQLYVLNRKRKWLPPLPYPFFVSQWRLLRALGFLHLLLARTRDGNLAAGLLVYSFVSRASGETMAWDWRFADACPSHFIWWQGIRMARSHGYRIFDFGRTNRDDAGLMEFKRRWGTRDVDLPVYSFPYQVRPVENHLTWTYRCVQLVSRLTPIRMLPRLGAICFRYWS